jgi:hypothetical protein
MVHSGFEATAVRETVAKPWKALKVALSGVSTDGPMAAEIPLDGQRPAVFVFDKTVTQKLSEIAKPESDENARKKAAATP